MTQQTLEVSAAERRQILMFLFQYLSMSDIWVASYMGTLCIYRAIHYWGLNA